MKKTIFVIVLFSLAMANLAVQAQDQAKLEFKENSFTFGKVAEKGGQVSHTFDFTNTGNVPLIISKVTASCGCTTPSWSKEPIAPGAKGTITASYNPMYRPGPFTKTITVESNAQQSSLVLTINGEVIPNVEKIEDKK